MKYLLIGFLTAFSLFSKAEIIEFPLIERYGSGYSERGFNQEMDLASVLYWEDFGVEKIYGFQLQMKLSQSSVFYGTSKFGFGINWNFLFDGSLYSGVNLNELSPWTMRFSIYKELYSDPEGFFLTYAYFKDNYTRFLLEDLTLFIATSPLDRFAPDTANAPYLPAWGEPLYYYQIPEPNSNILFLLIVLFLVFSKSKILQYKFNC